MCALVLAEEGNLIRTAERLHTSHSNVGRKVKTLQKDWGVELFRRNLTGFELTDEGRTAVREIRTSLEHIQRGFDRALYSAAKNRRPFRIGYSLYVHEKVLLFLQRQGAPGTGFSHFRLRADTTTQLIPRVLRGELHVGFGVMPISDRDLWVAPVTHEYFSACIPDAHPLKNRTRLAARDLANETLYWVPRSVHPAFYDQVSDYLHGVGHHTDNLQEASAITQGIDLAAHNLGVALVPQSAARFQRSGVLFKPLTDKLIQIETALFVRRDKMHGDVLEFVNTALSELQTPKTDLQ
jgi:LysR family transcriptional regulator, benzoate and cis,cis-muconate-responsive activator of ben and cat genes